MHRIGVITLMVLFLSILTVRGLAQEKDEDPKYSVLMITGTDKTFSLKIVDDELVNAFKKELDKEYREGLKEWEAAKKEAAKNKEEFNTPKPLKPQAKVLKKGLTSEEAKAFKEREEENLINGRGPSNGEKGSTRYAVIMVTQSDESVSFEVTEEKKVNEVKGNLEQAYKETLKNWETAKKEAKKEKKEFKNPRPVKPLMRILKKGLPKDQAEALRKQSEDDHVKKTQDTGGAGKKPGKRRE